MTINQIVEKFKSNPKYLRNGAGFLAKQWNCSISNIYEAKDLIRAEKQPNSVSAVHKDVAEEKSVKFEEDFKNNSATLDYKGPKEVKTKEDLIRECNIDLSKWDIIKMVHNAWGKEGNQNYQVKVFLAPIKDEVVFEDKFLEFLKTYKPSSNFIRREPTLQKPKVALILPKQDSHYNKYDVYGSNNIDNRFNTTYNSVSKMLLKANATNTLDEVVYIVGSDQFNSEWTGMTTKFTPQVNILTYDQAFERICNHEVETLNTILKESNTVKVVFVIGNHDQYVGWHLITWLQAYYRNESRISFDTNMINTKYYRYNNTAVMLNHGDAIKPKDMAAKFPIQFKSGWSECDHFIIITGDKHTEMTSDFNGIRFYRVPQLSNAKSSWDDKNGYIDSSAEMTAFVITETNGVGDIYKDILYR